MSCLSGSSNLDIYIYIFTRKKKKIYSVGSILCRVIPKTQKMVLDASLFNTQHYKVQIKGKWSTSGNVVTLSPTPRFRSYWKRNLLVAFDYGRPTIYIYIYICVCVFVCVRVSQKFFSILVSASLRHIYHVIEAVQAVLRTHIKSLSHCGDFMMNQFVGCLQLMFEDLSLQISPEQIISSRLDLVSQAAGDSQG